jgi:predicted metalloprotease
VGDDRIQRTTTGRVDPDSWTHGSAAERMRWFTTGRERGTLKACDTFSAQHL